MQRRPRFIAASLCIVAGTFGIGACGSTNWGDFKNVPDQRTCEVNVSLPTMACEEACPIKVKAALFNVEGVRHVDVDFHERTATVDAFYPACSSAGYERMIRSLYASGYEARIVSSRPLMGWETQ